MATRRNFSREFTVDSRLWSSLRSALVRTVATDWLWPIRGG